MQARAGKLTRIVRLIRLIRIVKLYKSASQQLERQETKRILSEIVKGTDDDGLEEKLKSTMKKNHLHKHSMMMEMINEQRNNESNVGKKLTDYTTKKVIIIILAMLFTNPIFMVETYVKDPVSHEFYLDLLYKLNTNETANKDKNVLLKSIDTQKTIDTPLVALLSIVPG